MRRGLVAALLVGSLGAAGACSDEVIVLATTPRVDGGASSSGARCVDSSTCAAGEFCERQTCNTLAGTCRPYPVSCRNDEDPVCGCDGVTYFNDCLRRKAGIAGADDEECDSHASSCEVAGPACPFCARLNGSGGSNKSCGPTKGRCWALPEQCPSASDDHRLDRWDACEGVASHCVDTCSAIRRGERFTRAIGCFP